MDWSTEVWKTVAFVVGLALLLALAGGQDVQAGIAAVNPLLVKGRVAARDRLSGARAMCDAAANQPMVVQAQASIDLENAKAVASEWGLISIAGELEREARVGPPGP